MTPRALLSLLPLLPAVAAVFATGCTETYLNFPAGDASSFAEGTGTSKSGHLAPGEMRIKRNVCKDFDLHPDFRTLDENALVEFLHKQGFKTTAERARNDLVYIYASVEGSSEPVRLRVAILKSPADAGRELHEAVLQHGPGSWGVHRANLAILGPIGDAGPVVNFAVKTKLVCWGVFTMAGRDDSFVIPGGYVEL